MTIYKQLLILVLSAVCLPSLAAYKLPDYEKVTLDNGLTVYLMVQNEVPLIDMSLVVKTGAVNDNKLAGLARLTAENIAFGTQKLTKSQLDEKLDFIGASFYSNANLEFSKLAASFSNKDQIPVMRLMRDMLLTPRFEQAEFDKYKKRHLLNLEQNKESPKSVIYNYFNRLVFGESGYGSAISGNANTVKSITLDKVKSHYKKWYQPSNSAVIIVGDFEIKQMKAQINSMFGQWENQKELIKAPVRAIDKFTQAEVLLVNKEDAIETTFVIGGKGIARDNPDRVGINVINTILGARFTSWLNDALRVNAGLTYGARSRFYSYSKGGSFSMYTFTKTATTIEAVDLALNTYQKLFEEGIDEKTLASAKAYVKGQFPPKFETSTQLSALLGNMYGYGFDESYINTFEQQVNSLDIEKAKQLINQYFPKENLQFVLIGKADAIRDKIAKYGTVEELNIKSIGYSAQ